VSLTLIEHPSVHPQEDLYLLFYGISFFIHISSLVGGTASTSLPEDEHVDVRIMSKTLLLTLYAPN
jgi:hypothetical protein